MGMNGQGHLSRRALLRSAAGLGAFALAQIGGVTICVRAAVAGGRGRLTLFVWSGLNLPVVAHEVAESYMKGHPGVTIEFFEGQNFEVYPKMVSARKLSPHQSLVHLGYSNTQFTYQGDIDNMWEALDPANIPNMKSILPAYQRPGHRGVGFAIAPIGLM